MGKSHSQKIFWNGGRKLPIIRGKGTQATFGNWPFTFLLGIPQPKASLFLIWNQRGQLTCTEKAPIFCPWNSLLTVLAIVDTALMSTGLYSRIIRILIPMRPTHHDDLNRVASPGWHCPLQSPPLPRPSILSVLLLSLCRVIRTGTRSRRSRRWTADEFGVRLISY